MLWVDLQAGAECPYCQHLLHCMNLLEEWARSTLRGLENKVMLFPILSTSAGETVTIAEVDLLVALLAGSGWRKRAVKMVTSAALRIEGRREAVSSWGSLGRNGIGSPWIMSWTSL